MILTESTMKYILTFILSFLSFLVCSQNITITDIPTIDQLPVMPFIASSETAKDICGMAR